MHNMIKCLSRSPSESSLTSGFDERSIDSIFDAPLRSMEAAYQETRDATETPVPDLEEVSIYFFILIIFIYLQSTYFNLNLFMYLSFTLIFI